MRTPKQLLDEINQKFTSGLSRYKKRLERWKFIHHVKCHKCGTEWYETTDQMDYSDIPVCCIDPTDKQPNVQCPKCHHRWQERKVW